LLAVVAVAAVIKEAAAVQGVLEPQLRCRFLFLQLTR
jgi:hypothetical protein